MTALTAWHDLVLPEIRGVTPEVATFETRRAIIEFCEQSECLTFNATMNVEANVGNYLISVPTGYLAVDVLFLTYNGKQLDPSSEEEVSAVFPDWATRTGVPSTWFMQANGVITLILTPADAITAGLAFKWSAKPTDTLADVDDRLWRSHAESIKIGTLARLMMMDGKPWSNPQKAALYQSQFVSRINAAAVRRDGLTRRIPLRTKLYR